jgi:hypothetical protein
MSSYQFIQRAWETLSHGIECPQGEALSITIQLTNSQGIPRNAEGESLSISIHCRTLPISSKIAAGNSQGQFVITWTSREIFDFGADVFEWDAWLINDTRKQIISPSRLSITPSVTQPNYFAPYYYGVGPADLDSPDTLTIGDVRSELGFNFSVTPTAQHVYLFTPAAWGEPYVSHGFELDAKPLRTTTIGLISYYVTESTYPLTSIDALRFTAEK